MMNFLFRISDHSPSTQKTWFRLGNYRIGMLALIIFPHFVFANEPTLKSTTGSSTWEWIIQMGFGIGFVSAIGGLIYLRMKIERERRSSREQLQRELQLEQRYRDLIENANDIIFTTDLDGKINSFNRAGERITGYSRGEVNGWTLYDLAELNGKTITRCLHSPEPMTIEMTIVHRTGYQVHLEVSTRPTYHEGNLCGIEGIARDISQRKKAEEELKRAYQVLNFHMENTPLAVIEWDKEFRVIRWSKHAEKVFGWKPEEVHGKHPTEWNFVHEEDRTVVEKTMKQLMKKEFGKTVCINRNYTKTKEVVHCEWYNSSLFNDNGEVISIFSLIHDVSDRKKNEEERAKLEDQVRHVQKMEAVGRVAGGIAHDFNNLLTVINGNGNLLQQQFSPSMAEFEIVEEICKAGEQAAALTRQLLAFSRKQIVQPMTLDLNQLIVEMQRLIRRLVPENIEVIFQLDPFLMNVKADPGLLNQMLLNLVVNARDAMNSGGKLWIRTRNEGSGWVRLEVQDSGCGMDEATKKRIFEPFFTTKPLGVGTGLGLSTVYNIVQQSGGRIDIDSQPNRGCCFQVHLPCSGSSLAIQPIPTADTAPPSKGELILLVEDEDFVRNLARRVLESKGYQVLTAEDGPAAIRLFEKRSDDIHLLLTDVMMPEMGGRELAEELLRRQPELKVIYMSGYTTDDILRQGIETEQVEFLQKPFSPDGLSKKVRGVLGRNAEAPDRRNYHPSA